MKYLSIDLELFLRISVRTSIILLVYAIEDHAHLPILNMPLLDNKKEFAIFI